MSDTVVLRHLSTCRQCGRYPPSYTCLDTYLAGDGSFPLLWFCSVPHAREWLREKRHIHVEVPEDEA